MTQEAFEQQYAANNGWTLEEYHTYCDTYPCADPESQGWQAAPKGEEPFLPTE